MLQLACNVFANENKIILIYFLKILLNVFNVEEETNYVLHFRERERSCSYIRSAGESCSLVLKVASLIVQ